MKLYNIFIDAYDEYFHSPLICILRLIGVI